MIQLKSISWKTNDVIKIAFLNKFYLGYLVFIQYAEND